MQLRVTKLDNKYKDVRKRVKQQREFDVMQKRPSRNAMARFREEPFQLRYAREYENRTKQQTKGNLETEQS